MISQLHYITQDHPDYTHAQLASFACEGGANWIQLRVKNKLFDEWLLIAQETKLICLKYGAKLIINDNVQIAKEVGAAGIHLGKEDMNPREAREILGENFIIGGSTNNLDDVKKQIADGCNYIGIGPFRFTTSKENINPVLKLEGIAAIAKQLGEQIPMIAIGGITLEDSEALMQTGVHGIAVASAINKAENKREMTKAFLASLKASSSLSNN